MILQVLLVNSHVLEHFATAALRVHISERLTTHFVVADFECLDLLNAREELLLESFGKFADLYVVVFLFTLL